MLRRRPSVWRQNYQRLHKDCDRSVGGDGGGPGTLVTVVVGKERREFLVEPFVLEESPFRVLMETATSSQQVENRGGTGCGGGDCGEKRVVFVDVDSILFEHMLWLMRNDCSSLFRLNLEEIIDFYAQDF